MTTSQEIIILAIYIDLERQMSGAQLKPPVNICSGSKFRSEGSCTFGIAEFLLIELKVVISWT